MNQSWQHDRAEIPSLESASLRWKTTHWLTRKTGEPQVRDSRHTETFANQPSGVLRLERGQSIEATKQELNPGF